MGPLRENSLEAEPREIWLREGERNPGFFHHMANSYIQKDTSTRIKINGVWPLEEKKIKGRSD